MQILRTSATIGSVVALVLSVASCSPADEETPTAEAPTVTTADQCAKENLNLLEPGRLTIATSQPAYEPWMVGNDPTNGKGYESAVAYAVADELGFSENEVDWVRVSFNKAYAPGSKNFDFDINQVSITPKREEVVDFSDGYYEAAQAVLVLKSSPYADATTVADFAEAKLGAQVGTTSLQAITDVLQPDQEPLVYNTTNDAKSALENGQIDGIVVDLPTAFYIRDVEISGSTIVGQFQPTQGSGEQFGLLFEQGNPLVSCVNKALEAVKSSGRLDKIENQWLNQVVSIPELS